MPRLGDALPQTMRWKVRAGLALVLTILIFTASVAAAQHLADDQFIGQDELKQNLQELESYTAEAQYLTQYYQSKSAWRPYVEAYASQLQDAVQSTIDKLNEHPHSNSLDNQVAQTADLATNLSDRLQKLEAEPASQLPSQYQTKQFYNKLTDQFQNLEAGL